MRRILVLTSTLPRWQDDAEPRFVLDLCRQLTAHASVRVLAPHAPGAKLEEQLDGVDVRRFRYFVTGWQALTYGGGIIARIRDRSWRAIQLPFLIAAMFFACLRAIREYKPDILHAHWLVPQGLVACLAARGRVPVFCTSHGSDLHGFQSGIFRRIKTWILARCCGISVVSESMAPLVRSLSPDVPVSVLPMGTDLGTRFTPPADDAARRRDEAVFAGRLVEEKGLPELLHAIHLLRADDVQVRLRIAGDGPLRRRLEDQVKDLGLSSVVEFLGSVPHTSLPDIFRRASLAVFPFTGAQGFGLVITEAMGCSCPVIASDIPAIQETIDDRRTGLLVPPGDVRALAGAIRDCLDDEGLRGQLAAAALASVRSRFDWPIIGRDYARAFEDCIRSSGR